MLVPTPEQQAVIDFAATNPTLALGVDAKAGSGKTATIIQMLPVLTGQSLLLAYNKSIQQELLKRVSPMAQLSSTISTVHAFGLGCLKRAGYAKKIDGGKVNYLLRNQLSANPADRRLFNERLAGTATISKLVGVAKNSGVGLEGFATLDDTDNWILLAEHFTLDEELAEHSISLDDGIQLAQKLLKQSNDATSQVDFDDMIYLPLLYNLPIPQFSNVIIDEAQDISATRAELASRACADNRGRLIFVGDPHQAIYGFTGADAEAMPNLQRRHNATILPLSTCFRCDTAIIEEAQRYVPGIFAKAGAGPGYVERDVSIEDFLGPDTELRLGDAVLCRLNRPNVAVALELLRRGLPVKIEGRDLGATLLTHLKKACPLYATTPLHELFIMLDDYKQEKVGALLAKRKAPDYLIDELDALQLLMERAEETGGTSFTNVEYLINSLFADDIPPHGKIVLSSIHKAKGREWPRVHILGAGDYMPFHLATKDWELQQEHNLSYVAITRAEKELFFIEGVKEWLDNRSH